VGGGEHGADLHPHRGGLLDGELLVFRDVVTEVQPLDVLHDQIVRAGLHTQVVHSRKPGVVELGDRLGLTLESRRVVGDLSCRQPTCRSHRLDGDTAPQVLVIRHPHLSHTAVTDGALDAIALGDERSDVHR
jgi:hypothetical protein